MRQRVELACESLYNRLHESGMTGSDDWHLTIGSLKRRREYARAVMFRYDAHHPVIASVARAVADACEVRHRIGGYAKRKVDAAESAHTASREART